MPAAKIRAIQSYSFSASDRLFFDTNVWLFINGPQGDASNPRTQAYSNAFNEIIRNRCRIFIDALTLSEFVNRYARLNWEFWQEENSEEIDFKEFRNSPAFKPIAAEIERVAQTILVDAIPIESGFSKIDIGALVREYGAGKRDFNDLMIIEMCKTNHLTLVTNDSDFSTDEIPILTNNHKLLHL